MEAFSDAQSELEGHDGSNGVTLQAGDANAGPARASVETMAKSIVIQERRCSSRIIKASGRREKTLYIPGWPA